MNPHLKGHKSFAEMVAGHLSNYHKALVYQRDSTVDLCDKAYYQHEINALADIRAACLIEMQATPTGGIAIHRAGKVEIYRSERGASSIDAAFDPPGAANVGMGQVVPACPKEAEVKLFGAELLDIAGTGKPSRWVLTADRMEGHPRLGSGPNVRTSQVKEVWDFDGAIFARTESGTLYKIMDWAADWIGSERFFAAAINYECLQGLKA